MPAEGDHVAAIGENRKLIIFPIRQVAEMGRGSGVRLQRYKMAASPMYVCFGWRMG